MERSDILSVISQLESSFAEKPFLEVEISKAAIIAFRRRIHQYRVARVNRDLIRRRRIK